MLKTTEDAAPRSSCLGAKIQRFLSTAWSTASCSSQLIKTSAVQSAAPHSHLRRRSFALSGTGAIVGHGHDGTTTLAAMEPGFRVELDFPSVTPQGHAVEHVAVERPVGGRGVHLTSPGSDELYVELVRFRDLAPEDEYLGHRPFLEQRFGPGAVTELTQTTLGGIPAWSYGIRWEHGERSVLLLQVDGDTYRVIHDPRSPLNADVVATLRVLE